MTRRSGEVLGRGRGKAEAELRSTRGGGADDHAPTVGLDEATTDPEPEARAGGLAMVPPEELAEDAPQVASDAVPVAVSAAFPIDEARPREERDLSINGHNVDDIDPIYWVGTTSPSDGI